MLLEHKDFIKKKQVLTHMEEVQEKSATILSEKDKTISRELAVFYNPVMKKNRDISILLLKALNKKGMKIADPLSGSGIRAIRFLKELPEDTIDTIHVNDIKKTFEQTIQNNCELSNCNTEKIVITTQDANKFILNNGYMDYIDIDPFGSPNEFLDSACKRVWRHGILAVTATDTAPLCGTYPKACKRKYWAEPRRDYLMHEYGLRILIRKCQLIAAQYEKALTPLLSYSQDHYFRIFFSVQESKSAVDNIIQQIKSIDGYGPLWTGPLQDQKTIEKVAEISKEEYPKHTELLTTLAEENKIPTVGFYDIHTTTKELKISPPKREHIVAVFEKKNIPVCRTHFLDTGLKADIDKETFKQIIKEAQQ